MTDKQKIFNMFDSLDESNHQVAWQLCKGLNISFKEVLEYKLNSNVGWEYNMHYKGWVIEDGISAGIIFMNFWIIIETWKELRITVFHTTKSDNDTGYYDTIFSANYDNLNKSPDPIDNIYKKIKRFIK